jgi:hypothetical protein
VSRRRALINFDLSSLPSNLSSITQASLVLQVGKTVAGPKEVTVFEANGVWHEGPAVSDLGSGVLAQTGDVTWFHSSFPSLLWAQPGGDFNPTPLGSGTLGSPGSSTAIDGRNSLHHRTPCFRLRTVLCPSCSYAAVRGVAVTSFFQAWLAGGRPSLSGFLVVGDESSTSTAKKLTSRESGSNQGPRLDLVYSMGSTPPPPPPPACPPAVGSKAECKQACLKFDSWKAAKDGCVGVCKCKTCRTPVKSKKKCKKACKAQGLAVAAFQTAWGPCTGVCLCA